MSRKSHNCIAVLSALALSTAPLAISTTVFSLGLSDAAYAKNGNGNGGRSGNGGGRGNSGAKSASAKGGKAKGVHNGGGNRSEVRRGGGGRILEALGLKKRKRATVVRRAPKPSAPSRPVQPRKETASIVAKATPGKSWKTRLESELTTPSDELGHWNSAKRSPVAIAKMAQKYRETGIVTGAGGAIGYLVVAHEEYSLEQDDFRSDLEAAIEDGLIDEITANRLMEGSLSEEAVEATLTELETESGALLVFDEPTLTYSCDDSSGGDCSLVPGEEIDALNADVQLLNELESNPEYADLSASIGDYEDAQADLEAAQATVQPKKSPDDEALQENMLTEVLDLLDIEVTEPELFEVPEDETVEPLPEEIEG